MVCFVGLGRVKAKLGFELRGNKARGRASVASSVHSRLDSNCQFVYCVLKFPHFDINLILVVFCYLKNLVGVAGLTQTLIHLYGIGVDRSGDERSRSSPKPDSPALLVVVDSPSWPISELASIVSRSDLRPPKSPTNKQIKRQTAPIEECCPSAAEDSSAAELPCLAVDSFRHLILSVLERIVGHHGDSLLPDKQRIDHSAMFFARQHLSPGTNVQEQRRLLRLVLRAMVSFVQHGRSLPPHVVDCLVDVALDSRHDFAGTRRPLRHEFRTHRSL